MLRLNSYFVMENKIDDKIEKIIPVPPLNYCFCFKLALKTFFCTKSAPDLIQIDISHFRPNGNRKRRAVHTLFFNGHIIRASLIKCQNPTISIVLFSDTTESESSLPIYLLNPKSPIPLYDRLKSGL